MIISKINFKNEEIMHLQLASKQKRALNFLIDYFMFYMLIVILLTILHVGDVKFTEYIYEYMDAPQNNNAYNILYAFIFGLYTGILEGITKGYTLGKIITSTKVVVEEDGNKITFWIGFLRGVCRMPFFEILSSFGTPCYPWHDKWTNTIVIDIKKSSNYN